MTMPAQRIVGIGIDIEKIQRFRDIPFEDAFYKKYFTAQEIEYCVNTADPAPHFAARFAAKEAVIKAWPEPIGTDRIEIFNAENGAPSVRRIEEGTDILLSLSHDEAEAVACAVVTREEV